ncbi:MAG: CzcE family metal-binding protein [Burkholderiales bacterium]
MKTGIRRAALAAGVAGALLAFGAAAQDGGMQYGTALAENLPYGMAGDADMYDRVITLGPGVSTITVMRGEVVKIATSGGGFVWNFDTDASRFDLGKIAPGGSGSGSSTVTVYVHSQVPGGND